MAHTAWLGRAQGHPRVAAALAAGVLAESVARTLCRWTDMLPAGRREDADKVLADAAVSGLDLAGLAGLFAEMYQRARAEEADWDREESFQDRALRLVTTLDGAGVLHGDLTPECAAAVQAVLDALSAPATTRAGAPFDRARRSSSARSASGTVRTRTRLGIRHCPAFPRKHKEIHSSNH